MNKNKTTKKKTTTKRKRKQKWPKNNNNKKKNEIKVRSSQLGLRFKQSQLSPKNLFGASTEFDCFYIVNRLISIASIAITAAMITPSFHLYVRSSLNIHNNKKKNKEQQKREGK